MANMASGSNSAGRLFMVIAVGVLAVIVVVLFLNMPDRRTGGERLGDAVDALPQGVGKAAGEFKDKTPAQKIGDKIDSASASNAGKH